MLAGGQLIKTCFKQKIWSVETEDGSDIHIGPNSLDARLGGSFLVMKKSKDNKPFDITKDSNSKALYRKVNSDEIILNPGDFVLASVMEKVDCSQAVGIEVDGLQIPMMFVQHYEGRSTLARLGLLSHVSAGFGDFGFKGAFTLELKNLGTYPLILRKGMRIGQIYFEQVMYPDTYKGYSQEDFKPGLPRTGKDRF